MELILQVNELQRDLNVAEESLKKLREEFNEYKSAMEFYMGRSRCFEALEQYKLENK